MKNEVFSSFTNNLVIGVSWLFVCHSFLKRQRLLHFGALVYSHCNRIRLNLLDSNASSLKTSIIDDKHATKSIVSSYMIIYQVHQSCRCQILYKCREQQRQSRRQGERIYFVFIVLNKLTSKVVYQVNFNFHFYTQGEY